jgi:hypothetical protein
MDFGHKGESEKVEGEKKGILNSKSRGKKKA